MLSFYDKIPDMECLQGDTLPTFTIGVTAADSLSGCRMQIILSPVSDPVNISLCKECTAVTEGFEVTITSAETVMLPEGTYFMHFRLIGADELSRRKLCGLLRVKAIAQGGN